MSAQSAKIVLKIPASGIPAHTLGEIYVAGSFNNWHPGRADCKLEKEKDGSYQIELDSLTDGQQIEYKFTRGKWDLVESENSGAFIPNRTATVLNGKTLNHKIENWEDLGTPHHIDNTRKNVYILNENFPIPQLNRTRRIWVYLPPDYKLSQNRYPVIYLQDGQNLFDNATSFSGEWGIDESLEQLFAGGDAGAIVVGVDNGGKSRIDEYAPWKNPQYGGGEGVQYMDFLVNTLKPYIDSTFRTLPDRVHTAIGGSSMGGLISMYGGIEFQQVFGKLLIFSPSFWFSPDCYTQISQKGRMLPTRIYMLCGTPEGGGTVEKDMKQMYQTLMEAGFDTAEVKFEVRADGQHSEWFWRREFTDAYKWLFETDANAVEYSSNDNLPFVLTPMPFAETFAIQWKVPTKTYTISIFSSTGQNVFFQILNSDKEINITGFPKGIYLLIIEENGNTYRKKILKE